MTKQTSLWLVALASCLFLASCAGLSAEQMATATQAIDHMVQAGVLTGTEGQALKDALSTPWHERLINGALWVGATYAGIQIAPGVGVKRLIARTVAGAVQGARSGPDSLGESDRVAPDKK
tara:strand:+ start:82 stop:444 length:363 start_codon:yes stop_codon:yes gene_type:complete